MIALIIILCVALFIALLLSTKVILRIKYEDSLVVYLRILFVKIRLYPSKDEKKRYPHSMSRRKAKKIKKALLKSKEKKKSSKKKDKNKKDKKEKKEKQEKNDILSIISIVISFVKSFLRLFVRSVRIKASRLHIVVSTEDASKTALLYTAVSQSVNLLFPLLEDIKSFKSLPEGNNLSVSADFNLQKSTVNIDLTLYARVGGLLKALLVSAWRAFKKAVKNQLRKLESRR